MPGKHFNTDNRAARVIVSGWKLGWASVLQSGFPTPIGGGDSGSMNNLPNRVPGEPLQVPKALQHWYNGSTTVTLPDGRQITPCANCFLQYNVDAFSLPVIPNPTTPGAYINDNYWAGQCRHHVRLYHRPPLDEPGSQHFAHFQDHGTGRSGLRGHGDKCPER